MVVVVEPSALLTFWVVPDWAVLEEELPAADVAVERLQQLLDAATAAAMMVVAAMALHAGRAVGIARRLAGARWLLAR